MKYFLATALTLLMTTSAYATSTDVNGKVEDVYQTVTRSIPHTERVCFDVDVPIYGRVGGGASAGDVLGGMIIGGLIGKGVTDRDQGAAAGAVIGGMIAADRNQAQEQIIGYRKETQCENQTTYTNVTEEVYTHSIITFTQNGKQFRIRFVK
jgi:hypothetical protein